MNRRNDWAGVLLQTVIRVAVVMMLTAIPLRADQVTIADGVYTEQQAVAGEQLYEVHCLTCHDKRYFRPVLKRWENQPLSILYTIMSTSMPESNPGALTRQEYVDILAYILSLSRYPSGDSELEYEDDALAGITVAPRKR